MEQAVKWQLVIRNAADAVQPPKPGEYKLTILNDEQVLELLDASKKTDIFIPVLLGISTGMRRGEVLGLMWKDVDLENGVLKVTQSLLPTKEGLKFLPPKSKKSNRSIALPPSVTIELKNYRKRQVKAKLRLGSFYKDNNLVCCYLDGRPLNPGTFSHMFSDLLQENGLSDIRFHDLRHSHASLLVKQGVQPKIISEMLGHSTINITMDIYSHVLQETNKEVANKFDTILKRKTR